MTSASDIRKYVIDSKIIPARSKGDSAISFSAREIHEALALDARFPLVCAAIDAEKFLDEASVTLIRRDGPLEGGVVRWKFSLQAG